LPRERPGLFFYRSGPAPVPRSGRRSIRAVAPLSSPGAALRLSDQQLLKRMFGFTVLNAKSDPHAVRARGFTLDQGDGSRNYAIYGIRGKSLRGFTTDPTDHTVLPGRPPDWATLIDLHASDDAHNTKKRRKKGTYKISFVNQKNRPII
jgi:hypothetical protein